MNKPRTRQILLAFCFPKTPRQAEKELGISKLKLKPFTDNGLLECLNPYAKKGRLYLLTRKAVKLLGLSSCYDKGGKDWDLIGWVIGGKRQRLVILKTIVCLGVPDDPENIDSLRWTPGAVRRMANRLNPCLSRISAQPILDELEKRGLLEKKKTREFRKYKYFRGNKNRLTFKRLRRYFWISELGRKVLLDLESIGI